MNILNTIFGFVRPITSNLKDYSSIISMILGKKLDTIESITSKKESSFLTTYLDAPLLTTTDTSVKKAMAVAAAIAKKRNIEGINAKSPMELASGVDDGVSRMKVAYQVGKGLLNSTTAAEEIIDRTAARVVSFTDKVIEKGVPIVAEKVITAISRVCPPATVIAPVIRAAVPFVSNIAKKVVRKGVEVVATVAKSIVKSVVKTAKKIGSKIKNYLLG